LPRPKALKIGGDLAWQVIAADVRDDRATLDGPL
jgi:hypothetical protein